jgi:hypothetical protein
MQNKNSLWMIMFVVIITSMQCGKKAVVPAYIKIESILLQTDYAKEGSTANGILDAWIFSNNQSQGTYLLPIRFPLIETGTRIITVSPGIIVNGQIGTRTIYPFYTSYDTTLTMVPEKEYIIAPKFKYKSETKIVWLEDFENTTFTMTPASDHDADSLQRTSDSSKLIEPGHSGKMVLTKKDQVFNYNTREKFTLPGTGIETFVELNYKTSVPLEIGFYQNYSTGVQRYPLVVTYSSTTWKKMYVKLTDEITTQLIKYGNSTFSIYIRAICDADGGQEILLDNLKLLHF